MWIFSDRVPDWLGLIRPESTDSVLQCYDPLKELKWTLHGVWNDLNSEILSSNMVARLPVNGKAVLTEYESVFFLEVNKLAVV